MFSSEEGAFPFTRRFQQMCYKQLALREHLGRVLRYCLKLKPSYVPRRSNKSSQLKRKLFHVTRVAQSRTKHCFSITPLLSYLTCLLSLSPLFVSVASIIHFSQSASPHQSWTYIFSFLFFINFSASPSHPSAIFNIRQRDKRAGEKRYQHINVSLLDRSGEWRK